MNIKGSMQDFFSMLSQNDSINYALNKTGLIFNLFNSESFLSYFITLNVVLITAIILYIIKQFYHKNYIFSILLFFPLLLSIMSLCIVYFGFSTLKHFFYT